MNLREAVENTLKPYFMVAIFRGVRTNIAIFRGGMNHQTQMAEILAASVNDINDKSCNSVLDDHHC